MKRSAIRAMESKTAQRVHEKTIKRMFARGLSHEEIAQKVSRSVEWVRITLDDFDPKEYRASLKITKQKQAQTLVKTGKALGRPKKNTEIPREKEHDAEVPVQERAKNGGRTAEDAVTVEQVLARYKRIREDFKAGKWSSIKEAAESEGLEVALVTRLIKGTSPIE